MPIKKLAKKTCVINGRFLTQKITGVQRAAIEIVRALDQLINNNQNISDKYNFYLLSPQGIKNEIQLKEIQLKPVGLLTGHLWEQIELTYYSKGNLLISLCNTSPILKHNQIVFIYDTSTFDFPNSYSFLFRNYYKSLLKIIPKFSKHILTSSYFSKNQLIKYCGINPSKIQVLYLGGDHLLNIPPDNEIFSKLGIGNKPFIFSVSSINPTKNFQGLASAINLLKNTEIQVVIAGSVNHKIFKSHLISFSKNIKFVGYLTDNELKALYEKALCFVYPSFYEGFGLPPLEAMMMKCPVIVSNATALPEVCGSSVLYFDPHNSQELADQIDFFITNNSLQDKLKLNGYNQAQLFSWKKCAQEILKIIENYI